VHDTTTFISHVVQFSGPIIHLEVTVPPNTTATVYAPTRDPTSVREGDLPAAEAAGVRFLRAEERAAVYAVGAGNYRFTARRGVS
jgi:alpha-L-rhamnosidase